MRERVIEMDHITKRFGSLQANSDVSMFVYRNEILSLLGENGAGKSTLMKVLLGLYSCDSGRILIEGEEMPHGYSPNDAMRRGVAMVHQHFKLVETFTVAQNIVLGTEQRISPLLYSRKKVFGEVAQLFERTGMEMPQNARVNTLSLGDRQRVEILKALYRDCRILILDEPTTVLTPQETDVLFDLLRRLQNEGVTIILITHKLKEVLEISERVVVMRNGRIEKHCKTAQTSTDELACAMVGRSLVSAMVTALPCKESKRTLQLRDVCTKPSNGCHLKGLDLSLYEGRIVGVAGVDGNGQTELVEVLAGIRSLTEGTIQISGKTLTNNCTTSLRGQGLRIIPEDRQRQGLVLPLTIRDNLMLGNRKKPAYRRKGLFAVKRMNRFVDGLIDQFDVRPARRSAVLQQLSGGNQQKVVLARELAQEELRVVVASQPTRGLDVGAIQFTHSKLLELRESNKTVLLISCDLDEIRALSDEIAVIFDGRIVVQKPAYTLNNEQIGLYMGGGGIPEVSQ